MHHFGGAPSMLQWCSSRAPAPIVGRAIVGLVTNAAKALFTCFITLGEGA